MSELTQRSSSTDDFARSPFASPTAYLSVRQVNMSDPRPLPSGRISRLASKVDTLSLVESHNARLPRPPPPPPPSTSPFPQISLDDANLPKSFNCLCPLSTPQGADTDAPWYRFCRPAAPVPLACDGFEAASPLTAVLPTDVTPGAQLDQENLSPSHAPSSLGSPPSPTYGQPLTTVSNILQSPIMFGERLPKWSVLRRPESNPMPTRPSSVDSLNHPSASQLEGDQNINSSRDSPHTPLVSAFDRRRSCFTSLAAPGLTRPTVLKRGPAMSVDVVATRASDFHATKRSATSNRSISEGCSVKKIRMYSLVPSENSAFLPVGHRGSLPKSSEVSPTDPGTPTLPPSFV
uniref:Uncharacterized protein n=1 Tax=Mesocestoides corti TaxID=53468 RepID=A0A5K3EMK2_MESCO